jgi:ribonuclease BN (tRNA processing enzyme)
VVLSGVTRPVDAVIKACNGCDVLFHEVVGGEGWSGAGGVPLGGHPGATELKELARNANPKLLVLYHQGYRGETDADLMRRIAATFHGPTISAHDLDIF